MSISRSDDGGEVGGEGHSSAPTLSLLACPPGARDQALAAVSLPHPVWWGTWRQSDEGLSPRVSGKLQPPFNTH